MTMLQLYMFYAAPYKLVLVTVDHIRDGRPPDALYDDLVGQYTGMSFMSSQSSKEGALPPLPSKPYTRSSSNISSQDVLEDELARNSIIPSQSSKKHILPPAPNKPCTRSRSKPCTRADGPADALSDVLMGQSVGMSRMSSQSSKEGTLPPPPAKPYTRSSSKISSQDAGPRGRVSQPETLLHHPKALRSVFCH